MGRKDAIRFKNLEDHVKFIQDNQDGILKIQGDIIKKHNNTLIQMRDLLNKLIEGE